MATQSSFADAETRAVSMPAVAAREPGAIQIVAQTGAVDQRGTSGSAGTFPPTTVELA